MNLLLLAFVGSQSVDAHVGEALNRVAAAGPATSRTPGNLGNELLVGAAWGTDIVSETCIVAVIVVCLVLYAAGIARLWRSASWGRGVRTRHVVAFVGGCAIIAIALLGPLDTWSGRSFAAHMLQHETLMLVAAPLLVAGRPLAVLTWTLGSTGHSAIRKVQSAATWRATWHAITGLGFSTALQLAVLLLWHVPRFFDAATEHAGLHTLQHVSFLASALCFWWATRLRGSTRSGDGDAASALAVACLFVTMLGTGALGALLTFSTKAWFSAYATSHVPFVASAVEDQQLGGLLMWVPGGVVYMGCALFHVARLLTRAPSSVGRETTALDAGDSVSVSVSGRSARSIGARARGLRPAIP